jgi:hypothetical protein
LRQFDMFRMEVNAGFAVGIREGSRRLAEQRGKRRAIALDFQPCLLLRQGGQDGMGQRVSTDRHAIFGQTPYLLGCHHQIIRKRFLDESSEALARRFALHRH